MGMYIGDEITERVEDFGGRTDNIVLRCSIEWNEGILLDDNDLDLWCIEPSGERVYYGHKHSRQTCGWLDVDITGPGSYYKSAVENITYENKNQMLNGEYIFAVHQFAYRKGKSGFRALIVADGERHYFDYDNVLYQSDILEIAKVKFYNNRFEIIEIMEKVQKSKYRKDSSGR